LGSGYSTVRACEAGKAVFSLRRCIFMLHLVRARLLHTRFHDLRHICAT
jgi:hypothetical protein